MRTENVIFCPSSRLVSIVSKIVLGKRLCFEHVCKVCESVRATCTFIKVLQRFRLRGRFDILRPPWWNLCCFVLDLPLAAGNGMGETLGDHSWLVRKLCEIFNDYRWQVRKLREVLELQFAAPRGLSWPLMASRGFALCDG